MHARLNIYAWCLLLVLLHLLVIFNLSLLVGNNRRLLVIYCAHSKFISYDLAKGFNFLVTHCCIQHLSYAITFLLISDMQCIILLCQIKVNSIAIVRMNSLDGKESMVPSTTLSLAGNALTSSVEQVLSEKQHSRYDISLNCIMMSSC